MKRLEGSVVLLIFSLNYIGERCSPGRFEIVKKELMKFVGYFHIVKIITNPFDKKPSVVQQCTCCNEMQMIIDNFTCSPLDVVFVCPLYCRCYDLCIICIKMFVYLWQKLNKEFIFIGCTFIKYGREKKYHILQTFGINDTIILSYVLGRHYLDTLFLGMHFPNIRKQYLGTLVKPLGIRLDFIQDISVFQKLMLRKEFEGFYLQSLVFLGKRLESKFSQRLFTIRIGFDKGIQ